MSAPLLFEMLRAFERVGKDGMPAPHRLLLLLLADFADEAGKAWPSKPTLSNRSGLSERTIDVTLEELLEAEWLKVESVSGRVNRYTVTTDGRTVARGRTVTPAAVAPAQPLPPAAVAPTPAITAGVPPQPLRQTPAAAAPDPIRIRSVEPPKEREARAQAKPAQRPATGPKPETPIQTFWRVFRELWAAKYRRPYQESGQDTRAVPGLAKLAVSALERLERPAGDLEALLRHWVRRFLEDRGRIARPGEAGYLEQTFHKLKDIENSLNAYGTPWDRGAAPRAPPPHAPPPPRQTRVVTRDVGMAGVADLFK